MVISFRHSCVVLSCVLIPCLFAKPFNLNEAIAAEERQKALLTTTTQPQFDTETSASKRFSLNKILRTRPRKSKIFSPADKSERFSLSKILEKHNENLRKLKATTDNIFPRGKKISSLQYRKTFRIKSPLKPKKLKTLERARYRRKNQSIKREISEDEQIINKYVPLLRSLSLLFDNILSESDDSFEIRIGNLGKYKHSKRNNTGCSCSGKSNKLGSTEQTEKAAVSTTTLNPIPSDEPTPPTTTEAPATTTNRTPDRDVSDLGQNTDLPAVLPRNTSSPRRDHNGHSKRSRPTLHASSEGNISRDFGDSKRDPGSGEYKPDTKVYEEDPDSTTREHASSVEFRRGLRRDVTDIRRPVYGRGMDETIAVVSEERQNNAYYGLGKDRRNVNKLKGQAYPERKDGLRHFGGDVSEPPGENKHKIRRDETESATPVQQFVRGDRRFLSEESDINSIQPEEDFEEGIVGIKHYIADQRVTDGDGQSTAEDQKTGPTNAALISIKNKDGFRYYGGNIFESPRENKLEIRGDATESATYVQQFVRGDRRFLSEESDINSIQPEENFEEGIGIRHYIANQRVTDGDGQSTAEDQKTGRTNEALISIKNQDGFRYYGGNIFGSPRENKLEIREDATESATPVQQFVRGDRRFLSEESDVNSVQPEENFEEGVGIRHYIANQRVTDGDGQSSAEDQKTGPTNAALISIKDLNNPIIMLQNSRKHKAPFVTIIDGYSVARDKNGANNFSEKSIRFHS